MSSLSHLKETVSSRYSEMMSTSDVPSNLKQLLQYGVSHPLMFVAGTSFICFAVFPTLAFAGFVLGTFFVTLFSALVWELFLIVCAIVGLAIALTVAVMLAGCCTGVATIIYFSLITLRSSLHWISHTDTSSRHCTATSSSSSDKED